MKYQVGKHILFINNLNHFCNATYTLFVCNHFGANKMKYYFIFPPVESPLGCFLLSGQKISQHSNAYVSISKLQVLLNSSNKTRSVQSYFKIKITSPGRSGHSASLGMTAADGGRGAACHAGDRADPNLRSCWRGGVNTCGDDWLPTIRNCHSFC